MPDSPGMKSSSPIDCRSLLNAWLTADGVTESIWLALRTLRCSIIASNAQNRLRSTMRIVDACGFLSLMRNCPAVPGQVKQVLSQFTERISVTKLRNFDCRDGTVSV